MLKSILMFLFILDAALLMVVVLLQDSKGQGLGGNWYVATTPTLPN